MKTTVLAATLVAAVALGGCQMNKQTGGTLVGAGLGGLAGSQIGGGTGKFVAVGAGVLLGSLIGSSVGQSLDRADQQHIHYTTQEALEYEPDRNKRQWRNPNSNNAGWVEPQRTYQTAQGQYCREFTQNVTVAGKTQQAYGTACRQPDGTWKIVQ